MSVDKALAGTMVLDGYPLPPTCRMAEQTQDEARTEASYYGKDMNWFIWHGGNDPIFPPEETMSKYEGMFETLGASAINYQKIEPGRSHWIYQDEFADLTSFIHGETVP